MQLDKERKKIKQKKKRRRESEEKERGVSLFSSCHCRLSSNTCPLSPLLQHRWPVSLHHPPSLTQLLLFRQPSTTTVSLLQPMIDDLTPTIDSHELLAACTYTDAKKNNKNLKKNLTKQNYQYLIFIKIILQQYKK